MNTLFETGIESSAVFDLTGTYRFLLTRVWDPDRPRVCWVMLNPSHADAYHNDKTVKQIISYAKAWNFGGLEVVNLFAFISTDPSKLREEGDPVGSGNDRYIREAVGRASMIVCAWGAGGTLRGRDKEVIAILQEFGELRCIGRTKDGHPWHPSRKSLELRAIPFAPGIM